MRLRCKPCSPSDPRDPQQPQSPAQKPSRSRPLRCRSRPRPRALVPEGSIRRPKMAMNHSQTVVSSPAVQPASASSASRRDISAPLRPIVPANYGRAKTTAPARLAARGRQAWIPNEVSNSVRKPRNMPGRKTETIQANAGASVLARASDFCSDVYPGPAPGVAHLRMFSSCHLRWKQRS